MQRALSTPSAVAVAILARWLFCFLIFPTFLTEVGTVGDQYYFDSYRELAAQVVAGNGYRVSPEAIPCLHRPPGYVAVLMLAFPSGDSAYLWAQLLNGLLGGLATWLTIVMCRSWGVSRGAALFAGWGVALWPFLIWETKVTVPENLLVALLPATFVALGRWRATGAVGWLMATGLLAGAATLTHALYQLLLPGLLVTMLCLQDQRRRGLAMLVVAAVTCVVVAPWVMRNMRVAEQPIGVATGFGLHYLRGLHSWGVLASGEPYLRDHDPDSAAFVDDILRTAGFDPSDDNFVRSDPKINRFLDAQAWSDIRARPDRVLLRAVIRSPVLWIHQQTAARSLATAAMLLPFVVLSVYGLVRHWQLDYVGPLLTFLGLTMAAAAIYPEAIPMRYALPLLPLLMFFSAHGVDGLRQRMIRRAPPSTFQLDSV